MAPPLTGARWWSPSVSTIAKMESPYLRVRYDEGPLARNVRPPQRRATKTQIPPGDGIVKLRNYMVARWGITQTWTPGRSRPMTDDMRLDLHQAGQGVDICTDDPAKATEMAEWLVDNADALGLQCIIAFGNRWYSGRAAGQRYRKFEGPNNHTDHLHIELSRDGAAGNTSWFRGRVVGATNVPDGTPPIGDGGDNVVMQWVYIGAGVALALAALAAMSGVFDE